jgi:hypothetical protein
VTPLTQAIVRMSGLLYGFLLNVYPAELRRRFATDMVEVFEDLLSDAHSERGAVGIASTWGHALWEFASVGLLSRLSSSAVIAAALSFVVASAIAWVFFRAVGV